MSKLLIRNGTLIERNKDLRMYCDDNGLILLHLPVKTVGRYNDLVEFCQQLNQVYSHPQHNYNHGTISYIT